MLDIHKVSESQASDVTQSLLDETASLFLATKETNFLAEFVVFLRRHIPLKHISFIEFKRGLQSRLLYVEGGGFDQDLKNYLSGVYLLDPYFSMYEKEGKTGVFYLDLSSWDNSETGDSFKRYWRRVTGNGELACLHEIEPGRCIHISAMLQVGSAQEAADALAFAKILDTTFACLFTLHFGTEDRTLDDDEETRRKLHERVSMILHEFGSDVLTAREREVVRLILKGQSSKSIATILNIAPGTVSIHCSNIYEKLGVAGHKELFGIFFSLLVGS